MLRTESFADGGITVVRQMFDRQLITDFQEEQFQQYRAMKTSPEVFGRLLQPKSPCVAEAFGTDEDELAVLPATQRILVDLQEYPEAITVNFQPPHAAMDFHKDNRVYEDKVTIVHGGDDGAFDFSVTAKSVAEAEESHQTIELNAGDVVFQCVPYIFHRGRNMGDHLRITAAIAEPDQAYWATDR